MFYEISWAIVMCILRHLLCYLIKPYPSKTHRFDDLFINAAIMQLATYEIDIKSAEYRRIYNLWKRHMFY